MYFSVTKLLSTHKSIKHFRTKVTFFQLYNFGFSTICYLKKTPRTSFYILIYFYGEFLRRILFQLPIVVSVPSKNRFKLGALEWRGKLADHRAIASTNGKLIRWLWLIFELAMPTFKRIVVTTMPVFAKNVKPLFIF